MSSAAAGRNKGVLKQAGKKGIQEDRVLQPAGREAEQEDNDSPWDSETDSEGEEKVLAHVQLPAADQDRVGMSSAAAGRNKGVLKQAGKKGIQEDRVLQPAGREAEQEDNDSPWDSETDSEGEEKVLAHVQLPAADQDRVGMSSAAAGRNKGVLKQACKKGIQEDRVLQPAGREAEQEDNDSPWDSETDSEGEEKVLANVQLPAADQDRVGVSSAAAGRNKAARAEQEEHFISSSENKLPTLQREDLPLKVDSSTQTDSKQEKQLPTLQRDYLLLKVDSSTQTDSGQEKQLKDLKEPFHKNDYYTESGKNALKEKKVITVLRIMQGLLVDSSVAAIPPPEERVQRLQIPMARLETTIQQKDKTIEVFEEIQQVSYRRLLGGQWSLAL
ncbi:myb-like protein V [Catharus ustulatus]|uniref:myb-like protein V n=1 Tax=Catharus ustulatus TaxID=91951 RepID=UPI00140C3373|nr:myb-like protein V [Catharus ustulatus]